MSFEVAIHGDAYEVQLRAYEGRLRIPDRDLATLCAVWRDFLLFDEPDVERHRTLLAAVAALVARNSAHAPEGCPKGGARD